MMVAPVSCSCGHRSDRPRRETLTDAATSAVRATPQSEGSHT
jgi:hypothetical protein